MTRAKAMLKIAEIIKPRTNNDLNLLKDICSQLQESMIHKTDEPLFELALKKVKGCWRAKKPFAMFVYLMKQSPFFYKPRKIA